MEQAVGGIEILEGEIAVAGALFLKDGVHPTEARCIQRQLTGRITADAIARSRQGQLAAFLAATPELQARLMGTQGNEGGADRGGALTDRTVQQGLGQASPGLPHRRWRQAFPERLEPGGHRAERAGQADVAVQP